MSEQVAVLGCRHEPAKLTDLLSVGPDPVSPASPSPSAHTRRVCIVTALGCLMPQAQDADAGAACPGAALPPYVTKSILATDTFDVFPGVELANAYDWKRCPDGPPCLTARGDREVSRCLAASLTSAFHQAARSSGLSGARCTALPAAHTISTYSAEHAFHASCCTADAGAVCGVEVVSALPRCTGLQRVHECERRYHACQRVPFFSYGPKAGRPQSMCVQVDKSVCRGADERISSTKC
jgi:hypothetical protein